MPSKRWLPFSNLFPPTGSLSAVTKWERWNPRQGRATIISNKRNQSVVSPCRRHSGIESNLRNVHRRVRRTDVSRCSYSQPPFLYRCGLLGAAFDFSLTQIVCTLRVPRESWLPEERKKEMADLPRKFLRQTANECHSFRDRQSEQHKNAFPTTSTPSSLNSTLRS